MKHFDALLREAQSTSTKSDRLWEIKESYLTGLTSPEIHSLVSALADHPNADDDLCKELLREWPTEALASTRFRLMLLADNQIDWSEIFDDFHDALPALTSLVDIPSSYNTIIRLFEAELLSRLDGLSCSFDWNMTCSHEISVDWQPAEGQDGANSNKADLDEESQDFTITLSATIDYRNVAILYAPSTLDNTHLLFSELSAANGADKLLQILERHGWSAQNSSSGDYADVDLKSVEPDLDEWVFSPASWKDDGSGTLYVTDPTGEEHEIELPRGDVEHSFDNYALEEGFDLSGLFDHDMDALDAFKRMMR